MAIVRGSALELFDAAVVRDVTDWELTTRSGAVDAATCGRATVAYRAPQ